MATFTNQATLTSNAGTALSNIAAGEISAVLTATKSTLQTEYKYGSVITYLANLVNTSTSAISNLTFIDNLGEYTFGTISPTPLTYVTDSVQYYVNGTLQASPTVSTTDPLTITGISVPASGNALIVYQATVNNNAQLSTGSTITNVVNVTGSSLPNAVTAEATIPVSANPDLSIVKCISPVPVNANGTINYKFTIYNYSTTAATSSDDIVLSDTFNPILSNLSVTLNGTALTSSDYSYSSTSGAFQTNAGVITVPAATTSQNIGTGVVTVTPGTAVVVVSGTI